MMILFSAFHPDMRIPHSKASNHGSKGQQRMWECCVAFASVLCIRNAHRVPYLPTLHVCTQSVLKSHIVKIA